MDIEYRTEPEYWEYLDGEAHPKGLGQAGTEWDIWLPDHEKRTKFIPDASFFSFERLREMSAVECEFPPCAPDVAVEVLSPGDSRIYLEKKIALYLSHGSLVVLDVDPIARAIRVHDRASQVMTLGEGDRFNHADVPWLTFGVREVFADLDIPA